MSVINRALYDAVALKHDGILNMSAKLASAVTWSTCDSGSSKPLNPSFITARGPHLICLLSA